LLRQWTLYSRVDLLRQIFSKKCFLAPCRYRLWPTTRIHFAFAIFLKRCRGRRRETIKCTLKCWKCQHTKEKFILLKSNLCKRTSPLPPWNSMRGLRKNRENQQGMIGISLFAPAQFPQWQTKTSQISDWKQLEMRQTLTGRRHYSWSQSHISTELYLNHLYKGTLFWLQRCPLTGCST